MKPIVLVVVYMAAVILLSEPVFAAKASLSDEAIDDVSGNANDSAFNGNLSATVSLAGGTSANSQFDSYQWSDEHTTDQSQNKGANNQSGSASQAG